MKIKRYRNPLGHMISRDAMLVSWLPSMLSWQWREHLTSPLEIMARWCETEAARKLEINAKAMRNFPSKTAVINLWGIDHAQKFNAQRAILLEAIQKLNALPA